MELKMKQGTELHKAKEEAQCKPLVLDGIPGFYVLLKQDRSMFLKQHSTLSTQTWATKVR